MPLTKRSAVALLLFSLWLSGCDAPEQAAPQPPEVTVVTLQSETITLTSELPGRIVAAETSEVRPQINGIIRRRLFEEGAFVEAGEPLYIIEDAPYRAALSSAKGALARAKATIEATRLQAERYKKLNNNSAISRQELDNANAAANQASAEVIVQRAAVETAEINLNFTRIRAPISGRIGRSLVTSGALVQAGQEQALATIQQINFVYVDVAQPASKMLDLREAVQAGELTLESDGAPVQLLLPNGKTYPIEGRLQFSEITVNPATGTVMLRATFPNPEGILLPGMYVSARLVEGVQQQAILVPQRGISRDNRGRAIALLVDEENKVERRIVTTERAIGDQWLVTDGLNSGDRLIIEGLHRSIPGTTVTPIPWLPVDPQDNTQTEQMANPEE